MKPVCTCCDGDILMHVVKGRASASPLQVDPSRMGTLRLQFLRDVNRRFAKLQKEVTELVVTEDAFGLGHYTTKLTLHASAPRRWQFLSNPEKVHAFRVWLQGRIDVGILTVPTGQNAWTAEYVRSAYKRGILRAFTDARRREYMGMPMDFYNGTQAEFLRAAFDSPEAVRTLELLYTRTFEDLRGVTNTMSTRMSRSLVQSMADGEGMLRTAKKLNEDVRGIGIVRARTIARTEIMRAHAEGQLDSFQRLGVEELGVMAEWSTAGDDRVCPVCAPMQGVVLTPKEARNMIPRHANCRCTWIPANVTEKEAKQLRSKPSIRRAIEKSLKKETGAKTVQDARRDSRWVGADADVSGKASQFPKG